MQELAETFDDFKNIPGKLDFDTSKFVLTSDEILQTH